MVKCITLFRTILREKTVSKSIIANHVLYLRKKDQDYCTVYTSLGLPTQQKVYTATFAFTRTTRTASLFYTVYSVAQITDKTHFFYTFGLSRNGWIDSLVKVKASAFTDSCVSSGD